jgi:hypothetical protein
VPEADWKPFRTLSSRHTQELAKQAICQDHAPRRTVNEMVQNLKKPYGIP